MEITKGLLYINGKDVTEEYGAFLCHDKQNRNINMAELLKPPKMKSYTAVNYRELDGEQLPDELLPRVEARDVSLQFAIVGNSKNDFLKRYDRFVGMLRSGWLEFYLADLGRTFRFYYKECTTYKQLTAISASQIAGKFTVKFREPEPKIFTNETENL